MNQNAVDEQPSLASQTNKIKYVVGIMSGKGGVGKSLVTGLFASALNKTGSKIGILDADITGPSIPKMFGISEQPEASELGIFPAITESGIKLVSINLFLPHDNDAVIWRGPMISNAIKQFWNDVFWGELDYLLVDLPPGTADAPLTVMQTLPLNSVIIVTSPQDLAAMVVSKAVNMCRMMKVPILGLIQNMAYMNCPECGKKLFPFGKSDGGHLAEEMGIPYLSDIAIDQNISILADTGMIENYHPNPFDPILDILSNTIQSSTAVYGAKICDENHSCS